MAGPHVRRSRGIERPEADQLSRGHQLTAAAQPEDQTRRLVVLDLQQMQQAMLGARKPECEREDRKRGRRRGKDVHCVRPSPMKC